MFPNYTGDCETLFYSGHNFRGENVRTSLGAAMTQFLLIEKMATNSGLPHFAQELLSNRVAPN